MCAKIICLICIRESISHVVCWRSDTVTWRNEHKLHTVRVFFLGDHKVTTSQQRNYCVFFIEEKFALEILSFVSLPLLLDSCLFGSGEDLGGCTVCHLVSEIDTKSFGCDLFELMVQNIVSTPTPRGNFVSALGRYKWPVVYLHGQHTHMPGLQTHTHTCTNANSHLSSYTRGPSRSSGVGRC